MQCLESHVCPHRRPYRRRLQTVELLASSLKTLLQTSVRQVRNSSKGRLNYISVYTGRGKSRDQSRLLYINADALSVWREMGMRVTIIGESHRPPRSAMLSFGMPFSE